MRMRIPTRAPMVTKSGVVTPEWERFFSVVLAEYLEKTDDSQSFDITSFPNGSIGSMFTRLEEVARQPHSVPANESNGVLSFIDDLKSQIHSGANADAGRILRLVDDITALVWSYDNSTPPFPLQTVVYDDIRITPGSFDRPGVSDPSIVAYDVNGGGTNTYLYEFEKNDIASFTVQIPHGYKQGQDIKVHVHWTPGPRGAAESGNYVGWKVDYSWANVDGAFGDMATADLSDACDGTDHKHQMTPDVTITGTGKTISSMLVCNVKRTDTGADDTWAGTVSGELPMILEIDFHFPIDTLGSRDWGTK